MLGKYTAKVENQIIRAFFALPIPREQVVMIQNFKGCIDQEISRNIRWVKQTQFHITMFFIAELKATHIEPIRNALFNRLLGIRPLRTRLNGVGVFPESGFPRVIWIGLSFPDRLLKLDHAIAEIFEKFGYKNKDRSFSPHLTIGRIGKRVPASIKTQIGQHIKKNQFISTKNFIINSGNLYQSTLTPVGPVYKTLFSVPFSN